MKLPRLGEKVKNILFFEKNLCKIDALCVIINNYKACGM